MESTNKTTGEKIAEMLCDGFTVKDIESTLNISHSTLEGRLRRLRLEAGLPYDKRAYKARKNDILANLDKWSAHKKQIAEIVKAYRETLVDFDF